MRSSSCIGCRTTEIFKVWKSPWNIQIQPYSVLNILLLFTISQGLSRWPPSCGRWQSYRWPFDHHWSPLMILLDESRTVPPHYNLPKCTEIAGSKVRPWIRDEMKRIPFARYFSIFPFLIIFNNIRFVYKNVNGQLNIRPNDIAIEFKGISVFEISMNWIHWIQAGFQIFSQICRQVHAVDIRKCANLSQLHRVCGYVAC